MLTVILSNLTHAQNPGEFWSDYLEHRFFVNGQANWVKLAA